MVKPYINFTVLCVRKTESCPSSPLRLQSSGYKASLRSVSFQRREGTTHARTHTSATPITHCHHYCRNKMSFCKQAFVAYLIHSYITQQLREIQPNMKHVEACPRGFVFCTSLGWNRSLVSHFGQLIPVELAPCIHLIRRRCTPAPLWIIWRRYKYQPTSGIELRFLGRRSLSIIATLTKLPESYHLWPKRYLDHAFKPNRARDNLFVVNLQYISSTQQYDIFIYLYSN